MIDITLDQSRCRGPKCAKCAYVCPNNVFTVYDAVVVTSSRYCKKCLQCLEICPEVAIFLNVQDND
ncbi:MAG: 4Fe-4S dicluster domain-containing protein [Methanobacteriaceae archaeon]|nr:4Fe-4S dicluster domain-containing protein [Methanobacteriaceae archaeon]